MDEIIKHGWHWSFGWLRRPELDQGGMYCYEEPDGDLVLSSHPAHKKAVYLDRRRDSQTGKAFNCFSRIPKGPMKYDTSTKPSNPDRDAKG